MQIHNSIEMRFNAFIKMIPLVSGLVHRIQSLTRGNRQNVGGGGRFSPIRRWEKFRSRRLYVFITSFYKKYIPHGNTAIVKLCVGNWSECSMRLVVSNT